MNKNSPFIIWTFRRSGGTNLGQALFESSKFDAVEHEPFNIDRKFKHVIEAWKKNKNIDEIDSLIDKILEEKILIKHCLEIIPDEINLIIAKKSIKYGYKHLFLYREEPKDRLLSLNYAMKTNVWGKEHLKTRPFSAEVFNEKIDIDKLINHEHECRRKMSFIWDYLNAEQQDAFSVSFEMLYQSDYQYSKLLSRDLFQELNNIQNYPDEKLTPLLKRGSQGTKSDYLEFPNSEIFLEKIKSFKPYNLYPKKNLSLPLPKDKDITHFEIFPLLRSISPKKQHLTGVLLSENKVNLLIDGEVVTGEFGLKSERIHKMFPDNEKSSHCRFISHSFIVNCSSILKIRLGQ